MANQGCMSLSAYYLEFMATMLRDSVIVCRAPISNTTSHGKQEKINSWVSFSSYTSIGLCLVALRAAGALLKILKTEKSKFQVWQNIQKSVKWIQCQLKWEIKVRASQMGSMFPWSWGGEGTGGWEPRIFKGTGGEKARSRTSKRARSRREMHLLCVWILSKTRTQNVIWLSFSIFWDFWANLNDQAEIRPLG